MQLGTASYEKPMFGLRKEADFEKAVKGELSVLYRVARRMGCSPEEAEDLVQIALIKAYTAWGRFDGRHIRSWLIRILRNERLMAIRSEKNEVSLDEPDAPEPVEEPFWNQLSWKLQVDRIMEELNQLPEIYKTAIHLCDIEQLSYEEAAEAMDIPIGTVRSRLFRARAMLREKLEPTSEMTQEIAR